MTVSIAVIMFELTGALSYVLPTMISLMISKFVGDVFERHSIADKIIELNHYPYLDQKEEYDGDAKISEVMTPFAELIVISSKDASVEELERIISTTVVKGFPVVTEDAFVGFISRFELKQALAKYQGTSVKCDFVTPDRKSTDHQLYLNSVMDKSPIVVCEQFSLQVALELFKKIGMRYLVVVERGILRGIVTKKDILQHLWFINNRAQE